MPEDVDAVVDTAQMRARGEGGRSGAPRHLQRPNREPSPARTRLGLRSPTRRRQPPPAPPPSLRPQSHSTQAALLEGARSDIGGQTTTTRSSTTTTTSPTSMPFNAQRNRYLCPCRAPRLSPGPGPWRSGRWSRRRPTQARAKPRWSGSTGPVRRRKRSRPRRSWCVASATRGPHP
jgi:hypothetical protein